MVPQSIESICIVADRCSRSRWIDGERGEHRPELFAGYAADEFHGADVMVVETLGELLEHWIVGIGRDALDDQLPPRHADRQ
jgi:hypothetical protein